MKQETQVSPSKFIKEFISYEYKTLGTKQIDGVETKGIEVNEPGFYGFEGTVGRLWIDIETNLPVRIEIEGIRGATETTVITSEVKSVTLGKTRKKHSKNIWLRHLMSLGQCHAMDHLYHSYLQ